MVRGTDLADCVIDVGTCTGPESSSSKDIALVLEENGGRWGPWVGEIRLLSTTHCLHSSSLGAVEFVVFTNYCDRFSTACG